MIYSRFLVSIIVFMVLAAGLAVFLVWPAFNSVKAISQGIAQKKARMVFLEEQEKAAQAFQKKYEEYKNNLDAAERLLVDKNNPIGLIEFIEKAAVDANIQTQIGLSSAEEKGAKQAMVFDLTARGNFSSLHAFIRILENGSYLVAIPKATMRKVTEEFAVKNTAPGLLEARFLLAVIAK